MEDVPLREELEAATAGRGRARWPMTTLEFQSTGADIVSVSVECVEGLVRCEDLSTL